MPEKESVRQLVKSLQTVYTALISGILLFAMTVFYLVENGEEITLGTQDPLILISVFFAVSLPIQSAVLFQKAIRNRDLNESISTTLNRYQNQYIIRLVIAEMPVLFSLVCYLLNNNVLCLATFLVCFLYFATLYPSAKRFAKETGVEAGI